MTNLVYFRYERNTGHAEPDTLILSGYRLHGTPRDVYPFGFANAYRLDDRSQALIDAKTVTVPDTDLVQDAQAYQPDPTSIADDGQLCFDFDARIAGTAKPKPQPRALTLEMCRGELLGNALKTFSKEHAATFVTLTPHGVVAENTAIPYPKGIHATGIGTARIRSECLWRLLGGTPPKPSFYTGRTADPVRVTTHPSGLGSDYTHITINGTVEIQSGKFTARIPTESE